MRPAGRSAAGRSAGRKGQKGTITAPAIAGEAALLGGLIVDLLVLPLALARGLCGDGAALYEGLRRPALRVLAFLTAARVTAALIALNLLGYAYEVQQSHHLSPSAFLRRFALSADGVRHGELLPLLWHLFAHQSLAHLGGNMLTLFVFGRIVERHLGARWTAGVYAGAATISTALSLCAQTAVHRSVPTLGASGAIAGLVALATLLAPFSLTFEALVPMPVLVLGWLAMLADLSGVTSGQHDGVDHFAHLGGYLSALVCYPFLADPIKARARTGLLLNMLTLGGAALLSLLWPATPNPPPSRPAHRAPAR